MNQQQTVQSISYEGTDRSTTILNLSVSTQIPTQPIATTNSVCLNDCLKNGSLIFAADNLRNFRKIVLHIEEFCK
ncbi:unnamed protein product [Brugia pahangi]|uniref:Uncharacterized protein n=1 Tax=Brugia pahangi TaxID=6280 RepID=A0A0N4TD23_BRUPA|nr:unnamed protein product [Brugia pahangi]